MLESLKYGQRPGLQGLHPTVDAFLPPSARPEGAWWPKDKIDNDFNIDWEAQKTLVFSGLPGTWPQDSGMQETMGVIADRSLERLGTSDRAIIAMRKLLLEAVKIVDDGGTPRGSQGEFVGICAIDRILPADQAWSVLNPEMYPATVGR